jgi:hypothetical protein
MNLVLTFENDRDAPHTYWIEPWAHDFTMLPGQSFQLHIPARSEAPDLHISSNRSETQIYINGRSDFNVMQDGKPLPLGHNRQS